jgi:hypothetical protein
LDPVLDPVEQQTGPPENAESAALRRFRVDRGDRI